MTTCMHCYKNLPGNIECHLEPKFCMSYLYTTYSIAHDRACSATVYQESYISSKNCGKSVATLCYKKLPGVCQALIKHEKFLLTWILPMVVFLSSNATLLTAIKLDWHISSIRVGLDYTGNRRGKLWMWSDNAPVETKHQTLVGKAWAFGCRCRVVWGHQADEPPRVISALSICYNPWERGWAKYGLE